MENEWISTQYWTKTKFLFKNEAIVSNSVWKTLFEKSGDFSKVIPIENVNETAWMKDPYWSTKASEMQFNWGIAKERPFQEMCVFRAFFVKMLIIGRFCFKNVFSYWSIVKSYWKYWISYWIAICDTIFMNNHFNKQMCVDNI